MARKMNLLMGMMSQTPTPEKNVWEGVMYIRQKLTWSRWSTDYTDKRDNPGLKGRCSSK